MLSHTPPQYAKIQNVYFFARLLPWFRIRGCTTNLLIFLFFLVLYPPLAYITHNQHIILNDK